MQLAEVDHVVVDHDRRDRWSLGLGICRDLFGDQPTGCCLLNLLQLVGSSRKSLKKTAGVDPAVISFSIFNLFY